MAKLLIVDDDPYVTESLKVGLGQRGHELFFGHNGREGVELAHSLAPDLVIIDMTMPIMDGLEATEEIRQQSDVPIIMLTAETDEEDVIEALETGVDEYLSKPFRINELSARIQALIRRRDWAAIKTKQEIAQLKQNMMATVTHELRTPIVSILSTLEIALASAYQDDFQCQMRFLQRVQHNTHLLNRLVDDLLILAQVDEGLEILRRPFSLKTAFDRLIDLTRGKQEDRQLTVYNHIDPSLEINGDTNKLRHLFLHLLENALKFSYPNQIIHLRANTNEKGDVQIIVADQGIGVHPDYHAKIFDRFFQIEQGDSRQYGGLGIGLTIAQSVAQAHGGHISISSELNAGSQFILILPAVDADWET